MRSGARDCDGFGGCYFERPAEKLVLEGYRHWTAGYDTGSVVPWEMAWGLYSGILGGADARIALAELSHFIRTLGRCAHCPLRAFPFGAHHICRDECLTLGLIAANQHGDARAAELCLAALACAPSAQEAGKAATDFAAALSRFEQKLLPIPAGVIEDILMRSRMYSGPAPDAPSWRGTVH
jgi:hypothetical protein